ncbi:MAG: HU family DNA-binding protein [Phycisphaerales bacterium]
MATKSSKPAKIEPAKKIRGKSDFYKLVADHTALKRKDIAAVFDVMGKVIAADLSKKGPRVFNVPGMMKILAKEKPAVKAGMWKNPFTGQEEMRKAKPASTVVKIRALKALKAMV